MIIETLIKCCAWTPGSGLKGRLNYLMTIWGIRGPNLEWTCKKEEFVQMLELCLLLPSPNISIDPLALKGHL